jgi:hypothetical protein
MQKFTEYLLKEYLDVYGGNIGGMGGASEDMHKKYKKILMSQAKEKTHPYAQKEVENLIQIFQQYQK